MRSKKIKKLPDKFIDALNQRILSGKCGTTDELTAWVHSHGHKISRSMIAEYARNLKNTSTAIAIIDRPAVKTINTDYLTRELGAISITQVQIDQRRDAIIQELTDRMTAATHNPEAET